MSRSASFRIALKTSRALLVAWVVWWAFAPVTKAQVCASPGRDGAGGTLSGIVNSYYPGAASAAAGATSISVGAMSAGGAPTTIASGDLLLIMQMQDAAINSTNTDSYGDGAAGSPASGSTNINNAGRFEYVVATSSVGAGGGTISIRGAGASSGLVYSYTNANASTTRGQRRFQVVRVPQYSSATLSSGLTAQAWNGATGGILAFDVAGVLNLNSASVSVIGKGFRGGGGRQLTGGTGGSNNDFRNVSSNNFHGQKGEGIAGTPRYVYNAETASVIDTDAEGYPAGATAQGAPANGGGGGTEGNTATNDQNSGGGGGANGGTGGRGGNTWSSNRATGGYGGASMTASATRLILGGGGGAGTRNNSPTIVNASSGGAGGGIVLLRVATVSGTATINAEGARGIEPQNDGGGGGGAGGSVLVVSTNSASLSGLAINARGANGTDADLLTGSSGAAHGPGAGGGGGVVIQSGGASANVTGGISGTTSGGQGKYGASDGTTGTSFVALPSDIAGARTGIVCMPLIELVKSVSPNANAMPGTDLTYVITFTNTGGVPASNFRLIDPDPATTLRLNTNTDFKLSSVSNTLGTTGLSATVAYSNDNAATWGYTPASGASGAPAGFDRNVTHIRWTFAGNLSNISPNNTGSVSFIVRVR